MVRYLLLCIFVCYSAGLVLPEYTLPLISFADHFYTADTVVTPLDFATLQSQYAIEMALDTINNDPRILPETKLKVDYRYYNYSLSRAVEEMIFAGEKGESLVIGNYFEDECVRTGIVGNVYSVAQISATAVSAELANRLKYPYISSLIPRSTTQAVAIKAQLQYYEEIGGLGWTTNVALFVDTTTYGITSAEALISGDELTIVAYQQFIAGFNSAGFDTITVELQEIQRSGARVIIFISGPEDFERIILQANESDLVGDQYVWIVSDWIVGVPFSDDPNSQVAQLSRGLLGNFMYIPEDTPEFIEYTQRWVEETDSEIETVYAYVTYDMIITAAIAVHEIYERGMLDGRRISGEIWNEIIQEIDFQGVSGPVSFNGIGERVSSLDMVNFIPETLSWESVALWSPPDTYEQLADVVWYSNSTEIPDLDIREPFGYWSCHDRKKGFDETGKTVTIHSPDGSDVDDIDSDYHCDNFIDCKNMSDESTDCSNNYIVLFIVFGVITGCLILVTIVLIILVLIFGVYLKYRRLRKSSPTFLIILLASILVGYISIFTWFGKPHPVSCAFQPWLLGLPAISMITALSVKTFRMWRIFKYPMKKVRISDFELIGLWSIIMIPAVVIVLLWTIIATPTAKLEEVNGTEHYVCTTGGFIGYPGGYIFFGIFTGYASLVLLAGMMLCILARKVPSQFNESQLIAFSTYNIFFLSVLIIPVFLVLRVYNPYIAWILRTLAILYAFTASLVLQFLPKFIGIAFIDKCKNVRNFKSNLNSKTPSADSVSNNKNSVSF